MKVKAAKNPDAAWRRRAALISGVAIMLCTGILYMWSVFQPHVVEAFGWSSGDVGMTSAIMISMFVVGNILGGLIQEKLPTRFIVYMGCVLFTFGMYLTAMLKGAQPWMVYLTYGVVSGFGCGVAYTTVLSSLQKWYAAKTGFITGVIVCSFGLSVVVLSPIVEKLLTAQGVQRSFLILALAFIIICYIASFFITKPSPEYYVREASKVMRVSDAKQYTPSEIIKTPMLYLVMVSLFCSSAAYMVIVPYIKTIATSRGMETSLALAAVMATGVGNSAGRILGPSISDKLGRSTVIMICCVICAAACLLMCFASGPLYLAAVFLIAFSYGGNSGTNPVISTELFGAKHSGSNYGVVMISLAACSVVFGKIAAAVGADSAGGFTPVFIACAAVSLVPVAAMAALRVICKKQGQKI